MSNEKQLMFMLINIMPDGLELARDDYPEEYEAWAHILISEFLLEVP